VSETFLALRFAALWLFFCAGRTAEADDDDDDEDDDIAEISKFTQLCEAIESNISTRIRNKLILHGIAFRILGVRPKFIEVVSVCMCAVCVCLFFLLCCLL
jgi:hypothetical protein